MATMATSRLTMVTPGLLGPLPGMEAVGFPWPKVPALQRLLNYARAESAPVESLDAWLCSAFGLQPNSSGDWPIAPLLAAQEISQGKDGFWLRADPVHLRPDRSRLVLFGAQMLAIEACEATALAASFNELYSPDGWQLFVAAPDRWYLRLPYSPEISTTSLAKVHGHDIDGFLPQGRDASKWHGLMNEIQMLFHAHAINEARATLGKPTINSLWFWGGGIFPKQINSEYCTVCADTLLPRALAEAAGVETCILDQLDYENGNPESGLGDKGLVVIEDCIAALQQAEMQDWCAAHERLEKTWWQPLLKRYETGKLDSLIIHPMAGVRYFLGGKRWWSGWRRSSMRRYFMPGSAGNCTGT